MAVANPKNPYNLSQQQIQWALGGMPQQIDMLRRSLAQSNPSLNFHEVVNYYDPSGGGFAFGDYNPTDAAAAQAAWQNDPSNQYGSNWNGKKYEWFDPNNPTSTSNPAPSGGGMSLSSLAGNPTAGNFGGGGASYPNAQTATATTAAPGPSAVPPTVDFTPTIPDFKMPDSFKSLDKPTFERYQNTPELQKYIPKLSQIMADRGKAKTASPMSSASNNYGAGMPTALGKAPVAKSDTWTAPMQAAYTAPERAPDSSKPFDFFNDEGYKFRLAEGNKATEGSAAARGGLMSGATLKALTDYSSGLASQEYGNAFNRYDTSRKFSEGQFQSDRDFGRGVFESDRGFDYSTSADARDYNNQNRQFDLSFNNANRLAYRDFAESQRRWGAEFGSSNDRFDKTFNADQNRWATEFDNSNRLADRAFDYSTQKDARDFDYMSDVDARNFNYSAEIDKRNFDYGANIDQRNFDYGSYLDSRNFDRSTFESDRGFNYAKYLNDTSQSNWDTQFNHGAGVDQRNFAEDQRRFDTGQGNWTTQFNHGAGVDARNFGETQRQFNVGQGNWQQQFDTSKSQWQQQFDTSKSQWELAFENATNSADRQFAYQMMMDEKSFNENQRQFDAQLNYKIANDDRVFEQHNLENLASMGLTASSSNAQIANSLAAMLVQSYMASAGADATGEMGGANNLNGMISQVSQYLISQGTIDQVKQMLAGNKPPAP